MAEELLEGQAVEEPVGPDDEVHEARPLPDRARPADVEAWRGEVRTAAIAAAGGLVAGAATVAAVRAVRGGGKPAARGSRLLRRKVDRSSVVASRSFLVDVHVLGR